ncbi:MAG: hypothetical protein C0404_05545 [Verrucomicrobia bacterium]|nr:hypothetical protein [Verrucomicrobiota bacterium]
MHNNLGVVLSWVANGEEVLVSRRKKVVARILPAPGRARVAMPDFVGRLRKIYPRAVRGTAASAIIDEGRGARG